jgi:hypothetical protein
MKYQQNYMLLSKNTNLQSILNVSECVKTHLQQCRNSKSFRGRNRQGEGMGDPDPPTFRACLRYCADVLETNKAVVVADMTHHHYVGLNTEE